MTADSVLIAALSGRALAAAARRAGLAPLVADAFSDEDMRQIAHASHWLPEAARVGFRAKPLLAALDALCQSAARPPVGLVLGSGFEDTPQLIATLAKRYPLLGNGPEAVRSAKDPSLLFALLDRLAIAHPITQREPPAEPEGWLSKRIGASGGGHVRACRKGAVRRGRYFQRYMDGTPVSLLCLSTSGRVHVVGFSQQWTVGSGPRPYLYGGATGPVSLGATVEDRMRHAARALCSELGLAGLVSFDFLLNDATPYLLEVNPRPSATLDIFDDAAGALLWAHIAACQGGSIALPERAFGARAAGVLYAEREALTVGPVAWPKWTADRPVPGTRIPCRRPIATVFAAGETATTAEYNCRRRLDDLARVLYGRAADTERDNAEIHRPRRERIGASSQAR